MILGKSQTSNFPWYETNSNSDRPNLSLVACEDRRLSHTLCSDVLSV